MQKILFFVFIMLFMQSCVRENTSTLDLMETPSEKSTLLYSGNFLAGPYGNNVNGKAEIYKTDNFYFLVFSQNFTINNGPDLYVYVSKEKQPSTFISLGKLKSVNGGQIYTFSNTINFEDYKYAVVHCQQYNHLFSSALLQKN